MVIYSNLSIITVNLQKASQERGWIVAHSVVFEKKNPPDSQTWNLHLILRFPVSIDKNLLLSQIEGCGRCTKKTNKKKKTLLQQELEISVFFKRKTQCI